MGLCDHKLATFSYHPYIPAQRQITKIDVSQHWKSSKDSYKPTSHTPYGTSARFDTDCIEG